jgi:hypothetical protein
MGVCVFTIAGVDPSAEGLVLARESCVEGRFAFRLPTLIFRPLVK